MESTLREFWNVAKSEIDQKNSSKLCKYELPSKEEPANSRCHKFRRAWSGRPISIEYRATYQAKSNAFSTSYNSSCCSFNGSCCSFNSSCCSFNGSCCSYNGFCGSTCRTGGWCSNSTCRSASEHDNANYGTSVNSFRATCCFSSFCWNFSARKYQRCFYKWHRGS